MMADNIEHVLAYWVLWQVFHEPWLVGFQIVSHWLPFLLFSVYAGALAERFDCRRLIQISQGLFMFVSVCWGVLFLTGTLELWHACVLLVLHGIAGCLWMPAEQMMLYDFVGPAQLPSAVRLNATFRSLAFVAGPAIGSLLLLGIGPGYGMFANVLFYLPLTIFLARTRFTGHGREKPREVAERRVTVISAFSVLAELRGHRTILAMFMLTALNALTVAAVMQNTMPEFAEILGAGSAGLAYGVLLFANGAGGVVGGFLLEATRKVPATAPTAVASAVLLGAMTVVFAASGSYLIAVVALFIGGLSKITAESTEMSIVQLEAPRGLRGRVIGAYSMFAQGMMTFSGVTIALLGAAVGIPQAVVVSGAALCIGALLVAGYLYRPRRGDGRAASAS